MVVSKQTTTAADGQKAPARSSVGRQLRYPSAVSEIESSVTEPRLLAP